MKHLVIALFAACALVGCSHQAVIPIDASTLEIDTSGPPAWGHAGAMEEALKTAAQETLDAGYDKFIVLRHTGCMPQMPPEKIISVDMDRADVEILIRMYHTREKTPQKAMDARKLLAAPKSN